MSSNLKLSALLLSALSVTVAADNAGDLAILYSRRVPLTVSSLSSNGADPTLSKWINTISPTGQWPDLSYTTGCPATRANWPAEVHWSRVLTLAAAYTDVLPHTSRLTETDPYNFVSNGTVAGVLDAAMEYWFDNDFTVDDCLLKGGLSSGKCICGTPGLWNSNWYHNVILTPRNAIQAALLLTKTIKDSQLRAAVRIAERGASVLAQNTIGVVDITGANMLDVTSNLVNAGIVLALAGNSTGYSYINQGFTKAHNEIVVKTAVRADGIRPDGSFGQHSGVLYNGGYGKDFAGLAQSLELSAIGTQWAASQAARSAFSKLIDASAWMIYTNTKTGTRHWDFSVLGRFISFAVSDSQFVPNVLASHSPGPLLILGDYRATSGLGLDFKKVQDLGQQWADSPMTKVSAAVLSDGTSNTGNLVGNRMFYSNDYMVQRGKNYVTTLKMLSSRSLNTECLNSQNLKGFHLGQGAVFNYGSGNEYEDIAAAWDWNMIPGITTDFGATPLSCERTRWGGVKTFVGGASNGNIGVAAMDYKNPYTGSLAYRKAWFFLPNDVQHVIVSNIQKTSAADVYHVLDQKRTNGAVYLDGQDASTYSSSTAKSLWHDSIGYTFDGANASTVHVATGDRSGNWATIGTSWAGASTVNVFQAWLGHNPSKLSTPISYTVYPDTASAKIFSDKVKQNAVTTVYGTNVSAAMDKAQSVFMAVFWKASTTVTAGLSTGSVTVLSSQAATVILDLNNWTVALSDPTQTLKSVTLTIKTVGLAKTKCSALKTGKKVTVNFPQGADLVPLAAAYTDVLPHTAKLTQKAPYKFVGNDTVADVLDAAMEYWFDNDYTVYDCLFKGGMSSGSCPCGTPGLWNTNWYSNVILIPRHAIQTALLLNKSIRDDQRSAAVAIAERGASVFTHDTTAVVTITGANTLDVASHLVDAGIVLGLAGNSTGFTYIQQGFTKAHNEIVVQTAVKADGIRPDGSFGQHAGVLYNGNYGKDFMNLVLRLELSAAGTQWAAGTTARSAFSKVIGASAWMIYKNTKTGVQHWDFSVLGRFISFAVSDGQATAGLNMDFGQVQTLGQQWGDATMTKVSAALLQSGGTSNAGNVTGHRMFYSNDYTVHRGQNYVTTLKMLSTRTLNNECLNSQNLYGFHLGQGALFNYGSGNEYEDIAAVWDWSLIPGITTDYGATPLSCDKVSWSGVKTFVGGASNGKIGVAAMDYQNPYTGTLGYRKAWFFLPNDVQHVIVSNIKRTSSADVYHVLDQKRANGAVYLDGKSADTYSSPTAKSLWHDSVGYTFDGANATTVQVSTDERSGDWGSIGTSSAGSSTVKIFQAWLKHDPARLSTPISYTVYPDTASAKIFSDKVKQYAVTTVYGTNVSAAMDKAQSVFMAVFWKASTTVTAKFGTGSVTVQSNQAAVVILDLKAWTVAVADPNQTLKTVTLTIKTAGISKPKCSALKTGKKITVNLPQTADLGKTVTVSVC
ncbi:hypothetical protein FRB90_011307 [Tulasnella sp. 427]|nr:hypothetical protein FRB90_011307 [Tulasnella sp. 427]